MIGKMKYTKCWVAWGDQIEMSGFQCCDSKLKATYKETPKKMRCDCGKVRILFLACECSMPLWENPDDRQ
jgi:hypothetical protein